LIAMSGGVDSSVAAYLMQQAGYECIGVTMKLYHNEDINIDTESTCCSLDDVEDAKSVANKLGMSHYVMNFTGDFKKYVIEKFISDYESGATPNPCIECNRCLKFNQLYQRAKELECDCIVTGHYARITEKNGRFVLQKAADESKDQSYVLYSLTQDQLAHTQFPLGNIEGKAFTRKIADEQHFFNSAKPDSQDICFVPDGDYVGFMEHYTGKKYPAGDFLDENGRVIGQHKGAVHYTIGQRKGLGLAMHTPVYVYEKDMEKNTVSVGREELLFAKELTAGALNWITVDNPTEPLHVSAKIRYRQKEQPATIYPQPDGTAKVIFDEPQRAATRGQAVVFYDGIDVVGGGTIL